AEPAREPCGMAERRQLTIMFCDLVGSTALAARLDPEDLHMVLGVYHAAVAEEVGHFGGYVTKSMGGGGLGCFGYPQAHEDDAERAVRAGLALVERVGQLDVAGEPLTIRIGIAAGLGVVGDLAGWGARWSTRSSAKRPTSLPACRRWPNRAGYCSTSRPDGLSAACSTIPSSAFEKWDRSANRCRCGRYWALARSRAGSRHCADRH